MFVKWPCSHREYEVFNLGTGYDPISVEELFNKIVSFWGEEITLKSVEERKRKTERELLCVDSTRLKETLSDYKPQHY